MFVRDLHGMKWTIAFFPLVGWNAHTFLSDVLGWKGHFDAVDWVLLGVSIILWISLVYSTRAWVRLQRHLASSIAAKMAVDWYIRRGGNPRDLIR